MFGSFSGSESFKGSVLCSILSFNGWFSFFMRKFGFLLVPIVVFLEIESFEEFILCISSYYCYLVIIYEKIVSILRMSFVMNNINLIVNFIIALNQ